MVLMLSIILYYVLVFAGILLILFTLNICLLLPYFGFTTLAGRVVSASLCSGCEIFVCEETYLLCGKCKTIRYCSYDCQKMHHSKHREECHFEKQEDGKKSVLCLGNIAKNWMML